jgi:hypothetical protein
VIVDALAVSEPPAFTFSVTAAIARLEPLVFRVVVPAAPAMTTVPPTFSAFAAIVNVTVDAPELNVTSPWNSCPTLAKVIVCEDDELNVIGALKFQEPEVDALVQDPDTIQEPPTEDAM